jgi:predicted RNA binding protein YcfA (HicA-like mRNA interferase family)
MRIARDIHTNWAYLYTHRKDVEVEKSSRKIIKRLENEGFELVKVTGSHHKFKKDDKTVTVPNPKKDLPIGTVRNIYKQAGWL